MPVQQSSASLEIPASAHAIYDGWLGADVMPARMEAIIAARHVDDFRSLWTTDLGGARRVMYVDLVEDEPDRKLAWQSVDGVTHEADLVLEPAAAGTVARLRYVWDLRDDFDFGIEHEPVGDHLAERDLARLREHFLHHPP